MTDRRTWLGGVAALVAVQGLQAQTAGPARKLGYLHSRTIAPTHPTLAVLRAERVIE